MAFGFAPPMQRRLSIIDGMADPTQQQIPSPLASAQQAMNSAPNAGQVVDQAKSAFQHLGIGGQPTPATPDAPNITQPASPEQSPFDFSKYLAQGSQGLGGAQAGAAASDGIPDALASGGSQILSYLASLLL